MKKVFFFILSLSFFFLVGFTKKTHFIEQNAYGHDVEIFKNKFSGELDVTKEGTYFGRYEGEDISVKVFNRSRLDEGDVKLVDKEYFERVPLFEYEKINTYKMIDGDIYTMYQRPYQAKGQKLIFAAKISKIDKSIKRKEFNLATLGGIFEIRRSLVTDVYKLNDQTLILGGYIYKDLDQNEAMSFLCRIEETYDGFKAISYKFYDVGPDYGYTGFSGFLQQKKFPDYYYVFMFSQENGKIFSGLGGNKNISNTYLLKLNKNLEIINIKLVRFPKKMGEAESETYTFASPLVKGEKIYGPFGEYRLDDMEIKLVSERKMPYMVYAKFGDNFVGFDGCAEFMDGEYDLFDGDFVAGEDTGEEEDFYGLIHRTLFNPFHHKPYELKECVGVFVDFYGITTAKLDIRRVLGFRKENNSTYIYYEGEKDSKPCIARARLEIFGASKEPSYTIGHTTIERRAIYYNKKYIGELGKQLEPRYGVEAGYYKISDNLIMHDYKYGFLHTDFVNSKFPIGTSFSSNGKTLVNGKEWQNLTFDEAGDYTIRITGPNVPEEVFHVTIYDPMDGYELTNPRKPFLDPVITKNRTEVLIKDIETKRLKQNKIMAVPSVIVSGIATFLVLFIPLVLFSRRKRKKHAFKNNDGLN